MSSEGLDLMEQHLAFYGLTEALAPDAFTTGPLGRIVGATAFGNSW